MCRLSTGIESHSILRLKRLTSGEIPDDCCMFCGKPTSSVFKGVFHTPCSHKQKSSMLIPYGIRCQAVQEFLSICSQCTVLQFMFGAQKTSCQILLDLSVQHQITYSHLPCGSLLLHRYGSVLRFLFIQAEEEEMNSLLKRNVGNSVLV